MSYYPEPDSHIRGKAKVVVVLDLQNFATKQELKDPIGIGISPARRNFIALKAEVDKLVIDEFVNVPSGLNNLKTKVDGLDVGKLKTVPIDVKKISDVVSKEVVKNTKF